MAFGRSDCYSSPRKPKKICGAETSLDKKGSRKIDGGNTSQCDEWAGPEQQVTDMQMQDWQGRKMVRSQQMDGDAQSSSGQARGCTHRPVCLAPAAPTHLQGTAPHPELSALDPNQGRAGSGSRQCVRTMPLDCKLGSRALTADLPPACTHMPALSLWLPLLSEAVHWGGRFAQD